MRVQLNVVQGRSSPRTIYLDAPSIAEARRKAVSQGFTILSVHKGRLPLDLIPLHLSVASAFNVRVFIEQLRDLLVAGLSVVEALDALSRGSKDKSTIDQIRRQLQEGKPLSAALSVDLVFPPLLVALVRASEFTSDLPQTLSRFLEHEQRVAEVRHRIVSTSIYPILLVGVGGLVLIFLLFYVMPRFARVFEGLTGELPWSARAMLAWSHSLQTHGLWWGSLAAIIALAASSLIAVPTLRTAVLRRAMEWAPLRERLKVHFLSRWYRTVGMLVQRGIPFPQALQLAQDLLPQALLPNARAVEQGIREGLSPSAAHTRAGMATPVAEQLLIAGERTGDLGTVLTRIAHFHESEVSRQLESTMRALEPIVMVLIGLGVGIVVILMYLPIFELASSIQ